VNVLTYYGQRLPVDQTYAYRGRLGPLASETSSTIALPVDDQVDRVDFGFDKPNPGVALDKSPGSASCDATAGLCTVTWDITVTNTGSDALAGIVLADRLPGGLNGVTATNVTLTRLDNGAPVATVTSPASTTTTAGLTTYTYSIGSLPGFASAPTVDGSNAGLAAGASVAYRVSAQFI
jgi:uncharacterized repeat protein (TIGR01451 family)